MTESTEKHVFVLGAGFTKAFFPAAPLLVDKYDMEELFKHFDSFKYARDILANEVRLSGGKEQINIERLLTRLHSGMPYDGNFEVDAQLELLLQEVLAVFTERIVSAREGGHFSELNSLAEHIIRNNISCLTFNYDDLLDEALWSRNPEPASDSPTSNWKWHPNGGYGFFCKSSVSLTIDEEVMAISAMRLLKMHGSLNWRIKLGAPMPYTSDSIVHHEPWLKSHLHPRWREPDVINRQLQPQPFIVPPVLSKADLVSHPILRLVWSQAYQELKNADSVTFVGYSMPRTDVTSATLFSETIDAKRVTVVNLCTDPNAKLELISSYRETMPEIEERSFKFIDALEWAVKLTDV